MNKLYFLVTILILINACNSNTKTIGGKQIILSEILPYLEECDLKVNYQLDFHIKHESLEISELKKFNLILVLDGIKIYDDIFSENIKIVDLCENHIKFPINTLEIYLKVRGKSYVFNKKSSFDIQKHKFVYIKLLSVPRNFGDSYLIKFDNQFFYSYVSFPFFRQVVNIKQSDLICFA